MSIEEYSKDKDIVHAYEVMRDFHVDVKTAYKMLEDSNLTSILEPYCDKCNRYSREYFDSFFDTPDEYKCPHCGEKIDLATNLIVVYKHKK